MAAKDNGWPGINTVADWRNATDALALWCTARDQTRFNRRVVNASREKKFNRRLLYLLGVAICRRLEHLFPDPCCLQAVQVAEAFAEGIATLDEMVAAHDAVDAVHDSDLPVAVVAAVGSAFWLSPDEYKVGRVVEGVIHVAGFQAAVKAGVLAADSGFHVGWSVCGEHPVFVAGKEEEEKVLCDLIRDVLGNPFQPMDFLPSWWTATVAVITRDISERNDFTSLGVMGDALQDAGCSESRILSHCQSPGPHVRGCWVVDLILGQS